MGEDILIKMASPLSRRVMEQHRLNGVFGMVVKYGAVGMAGDYLTVETMKSNFLT